MAVLLIIIGAALLIVGATVEMRHPGQRLTTAFGILLLVVGVLLLLLPIAGVTVIR